MYLRNQNPSTFPMRAPSPCEHLPRTRQVAYVRALPQLAIGAHPSVAGVTSFTMLAPCGPRAAPGDGSCDGDGGHATWVLDVCAKGCAVADAFAAVSDTWRGR